MQQGVATDSLSNNFRRDSKLVLALSFGRKEVPVASNLVAHGFVGQGELSNRWTDDDMDAFLRISEDIKWLDE